MSIYSNATDEVTIFEVVNDDIKIKADLLRFDGAQPNNPIVNGVATGRRI